MWRVRVVCCIVCASRRVRTPQRFVKYMRIIYKRRAFRVEIRYARNRTSERKNAPCGVRRFTLQRRSCKEMPFITFARKTPSPQSRLRTRIHINTSVGVFVVLAIALHALQHPPQLMLLYYNTYFERQKTAHLKLSLFIGLPRVFCCFVMHCIYVLECNTMRSARRERMTSILSYSFSTAYVVFCLDFQIN